MDFVSTIRYKIMYSKSNYKNPLQLVATQVLQDTQEIVQNHKMVLTKSLHLQSTLFLKLWNFTNFVIATFKHSKIALLTTKQIKKKKRDLIFLYGMPFLENNTIILSRTISLHMCLCHVFVFVTRVLHTEVRTMQVCSPTLHLFFLSSIPCQLKHY